ncbi:heterokaryon incompatibility protein-domain-containing protein [Nemania abortiva]|nr:heterokaryon incompatibility protein-domain-containing protein [Nemania abortiva]
MRCASCAQLDIEDFVFGGARRLQDSVSALKASGEAGCDLCKLFWACLAQRHGEAALGCLLRGLGNDGDVVADASVWLEGELFPSYEPRLLGGSGGGGGDGNHLRLVLGETGSTKAFGDSMGTLHIFNEPGTQAAQFFGETWSTVDRNPTLYLDLARRWLSYCRTNHKFCSTSFFGTAATRLEMPTRLIDIGGPRDGQAARLIITRTSGITAAPYLALSYCWGTSAESTTWLRDDNLSALRSRIDEERLPRTHRDMFRLARDLGFRYVWIDALCIIQGNAEDWEHESKRMAVVYGNAALTIVAGRARDVQEGFLENRLRHVAGPCALPYSNERELLTTGEMGKMWVSLPRKAGDGPTSERGWCFQESLLSPRALVFGADQLSFQCQELRIWEDGSTQRSQFRRIRNPNDPEYSLIPRTSPDSSAPLTSPGAPFQQDEESRRRMLIFWYKGVLWQYNRRKLTNQDDIFAAVSGLAQAIQPKIRSRYLAGLWEVDMVRGLLWEPRAAPHPAGQLRFPCERRVTAIASPFRKDGNGVQARVVPVQAPSWSWARFEGFVQMDAWNRAERDYHEPAWQVRQKYTGRWTKDPVCHAAAAHIPSCELEFFGRPRRAKCIPYYPQENKVNMSSERAAKIARFKSARVYLVSMQEDDTDPVAMANRGSDDVDSIVGSGHFDVAEERVDNCWCLPLTNKKGLMLLRNEQGKFCRVGTMEISDLAWMTSAQEEEVCLI